MSGAISFGPREEKPATTGASESVIASVVNISASGFL